MAEFFFHDTVLKFGEINVLWTFGRAEWELLLIFERKWGWRLRVFLDTFQNLQSFKNVKALKIASSFWSSKTEICGWSLHSITWCQTTTELFTYYIIMTSSSYIHTSMNLMKMYVQIRNHTLINKPETTDVVRFHYVHYIQYAPSKTWMVAKLPYEAPGSLQNLLNTVLCI